MGGQSLVFRVDSHLAAIGLEHVTEVLRPLPVEPLAGVPSYVTGVCVLRGRPVPVVDVGRLLGGEPTGDEPNGREPTGREPNGLEPNSETKSETKGGSERFVGVRTGGQTAALAVDTVVGIRDVPLDLLHDLSSITGTETRVGAIDAEPLLWLAAARVIPESVWEALEESGATA